MFSLPDLRDLLLVGVALSRRTFSSSILRRWAGDRRGNIALMSALLLAPLLLGVAGALQVSAVTTFRGRTQDVADSAALFGAQQLGLDASGAGERTEAWARAQLGAESLGKVVAIRASVIDSKKVRVSIDGQVTSMLGDAAGAFSTHAESMAEAVSAAPLCVLVFGTKDKSYYLTKNQNLQIDGQGLITAATCSVYSDQDINAAGDGVHLEAADVEAVGRARGGITPAPLSGAAYVADPFSAVDVSFPDTCSKGPRVETKITSDTALNPGLHCDHITVSNGAKLTLLPGEHYFSGNLTMQDTSQLFGYDVVLDFSKSSKFDFGGSSEVSLDGRRSGKLAGFVIVSDRLNDKDFTIESDHVGKLVGTIYIPMAQLVIDGKDRVAQRSPWTVVVAQAVHVKGSSNLVINSDYATSTVPVPTGVGPLNKGSRIVR